jgi:hypothetical protein
MAGWIWRRVQRAGERELPRSFALSPVARHGALVLLIALSAGWACWVVKSRAPGFPDDAAELRQLLRGAGIAAAQALAAGVLAYAFLMTVLTRNCPRDTGPASRSPGGR